MVATKVVSLLELIAKRGAIIRVSWIMGEILPNQKKKQRLWRMCLMDGFSYFRCTGSNRS